MGIFDITEIAKETVSKYVKNGDCVIDATCGNGEDTCFLAETTGEQGHVYAFDIQERAIINTKNKLLNKGLSERVSVIYDSHDKVDDYVFEPISAVMFNLGYLPKGDTNIVTTGSTTVAALSKCISLLKKNGVITICVYVAHKGGKEEEDMLKKYIENLFNNSFKVLKYYILNNDKAPYIYMIHKIK